jgi:L-rhamnose mutarotase
MQRHAFKMHLKPGMTAEYRKRHDDIWPQLVDLLHTAGIGNYSIWLDEETNTLFGYLERTDSHTIADLPEHPVMRRWWQYMKDIMHTNNDGSPVVSPITEVFYMK